jgi:deoxyribodipyrimidine photo-lyase
MAMQFPTVYTSIIQQLENIKPLQYAKTRNFVDGDVTYLSPYISRGVLSLPQVAKQALKKHRPFEIQKFLQELAWREYWQRVWQHLGNKIFTDIKQPQQNISHYSMAAAINNAATGIEAIDKCIHKLYETGYMHNHVRMYVSSIACNIGKAHWLAPSKWMYYHLLDGDLASNSLSWQWVAGSFASKKYYCNQENINHYTHSLQQSTFLDNGYEVITEMVTPTVLEETIVMHLPVELPLTNLPVLMEDKPVLVYNACNIDPMWHTNEKVNRILLLEPSHYQTFPVSKKVINFIMELSKNIEGIQIFTGEFDDLKNLCGKRNIIYKQHPAFSHYSGIAEQYEELFPEVNDYYNSFSAYWKRCEKYLKDL